ncbi:hypothetical protein BZB76_1522 [Actinomadura pelletieri DSM 43383]|uniref:Uncharacterized protein n=1 Tax=Actinomadura pelletieri DSM 43383 TaxID=1120940 RepID=A0A495QRQ5_9ACTN|nr:hypothetical protein BZB76_1522 [Actinomadura pelletieri DSM 43383]
MKEQRSEKLQLTPRKVLPFLLGITGIAAAAFLMTTLGGDSKPPTREVKELPGPPAPSPSTVEGPRLAKERKFTYADSAYGKCLMQHGIKKLPPLTEPLALNTNDPTVAKATQQCKSLAPTSPTPTKS